MFSFRAVMILVILFFLSTSSWSFKWSARNHKIKSSKSMVSYHRLNMAFSGEMDDREFYEGNIFTDKFPLPMKADSQKVLLKWFCMLRKLRDFSITSPLSEISKRTGLSCEMLALLISMATELERTLIWSNMRLVHFVARRYQGRGLDLDDLIGEGVKGLKRAVERFDASRGYTLSTYAVPWIKEYIIKALASANPITLPRSVYNLLVKVRGIRERLCVTLGRTPTDEDLADEMGINVKRLDIVRRALALEARMGEGEMQGEQDLLAFDDEVEASAKAQVLNKKIEQVRSTQPPPGDTVILREVHIAVLQALLTLPKEEARAIYHRLGLGQSDTVPTLLAFNATELVPSKEELQALYHKGMRRLRRRTMDPMKYPEVNNLGVIFREGQVKQEQQYANL